MWGEMPPFLFEKMLAIHIVLLYNKNVIINNNLNAEVLMLSEYSIVQSIIDSGITEYPDHKGRIWKVVRYGDKSEGIKVETVEDGIRWSGWITYNDASLYRAGEAETISACWQEEV